MVQLFINILDLYIFTLEVLKIVFIMLILDCEVLNYSSQRKLYVSVTIQLPLSKKNYNNKSE